MKRVTLLAAILSCCVFLHAQITRSEDYTVRVGEKKIFTTFNHHDDGLYSGGGGIPLPDQMVSSAAGNNAQTEIAATQNTNGIAQAFVGLIFNIDTSDFSWQKIRDMPVHVTVNFAYSLYAVNNGWGSADAHIALNPFPEPSYWFDGVSFTVVGEASSGFMFPQTRSGMFTIGEILSLGGMIRFHIYSHAHLASNNDGITQNAASAAVFIDAISITVAPDPDSNIDCDVDGEDLARLVKAFGTTNADIDFDPLGDFVFDGLIDTGDLEIFASRFGELHCLEQM